MASIDILAKNNGQIIQSLNADSVILNQNSVVKIGVKIEDRGCCQYFKRRKCGSYHT